MKRLYMTPEVELLTLHTETALFGASENKVGKTVLIDTTPAISSPGPEIGEDDQEIDDDLAKRHKWMLW